MHQDDNNSKSKRKSEPWCWVEKPKLKMIADVFESISAKSVNAARSIYLAVAEIASDRQSDTFDATQAEIAHRASSSVATVKRILPTLKQIGLVTIKRNFIHGVETRSTYTLNRGALAHHERALVQTRKTKRATEEECSEESVPLGVDKRIRVPRNLRDASKSARKVRRDERVAPPKNTRRGSAARASARSLSSFSSEQKPRGLSIVSEKQGGGSYVEPAKSVISIWDEVAVAADLGFLPVTIWTKATEEIAIKYGSDLLETCRLFEHMVAEARRNPNRKSKSLCRMLHDCEKGVGYFTVKKASKPRYLPSVEQQRAARRARDAKEKADKEKAL